MIRKKACAALWRIFRFKKRAAANIGKERGVYKPSSEECGDYRVFVLRSRDLLKFKIKQKKEGDEQKMAFARVKLSG